MRVAALLRQRPADVVVAVGAQLAMLGDALGSLRILVGAIGAVPTAAVIAEVSAARLRGQPFAHLPAPTDRRERLSRGQVGPAILLYRALAKRLGRERALELTGEVVVAATLVWLGRAVGDIDRDQLMAMSVAERQAWVTRTGDKFFNATMRWDEVSEERVVMTVTRCRFPELCAAAGAPEVAPLMCRGDEHYFGGSLPAVELIRPYTLADGGDSCPFELRWRSTR